MMIVVRLSSELSEKTLASVRDVEGLDRALGGEPRALWLRGSSQELDRLRSLPALGLFELRGEHDLVPLGRQLPTDRLPRGLDWRPLREHCRVSMPTAAMPGVLEADWQSVSLTLTRMGQGDQAPDLLLTSLEALHRYVDCVSGARLKGLRFAVSGDGRALLLGRPLLPLLGRGYRVTERLGLPLGYGWSLPVAEQTLRRLLGVDASEWAILHEDGSFDRLRDEDFLDLSRSAVRLTFERYQMEKMLTGMTEEEGEVT